MAVIHIHHNPMEKSNKKSYYWPSSLHIGLPFPTSAFMIKTLKVGKEHELNKNKIKLLRKRNIYKNGKRIKSNSNIKL